jgi:hypothetical protein
MTGDSAPIVGLQGKAAQAGIAVKVALFVALAYLNWLAGLFESAVR